MTGSGGGGVMAGADNPGSMAGTTGSTGGTGSVEPSPNSGGSPTDTTGSVGGAGGGSQEPGTTSDTPPPDENPGANACSGGTPASGFYVEGGRLYDNRCNEFVIRGVNYPYAWYSSQDTEQRFAEIAGVGANAVRVVLATGGQWSRVDGNTLSNIIEWAKANKLVAILEVHDSTGWAESANAVHPDNAVEYWLSADILSAIVGNEAYVIINIANEPFGNDTTDLWEPFHVQAVKDLRAGGIHHTLMVDAPNWGQDWTATMLEGDGAPNIFNADPDKNVVFSVHMYDVYWDSMIVDDYFNVFTMKGVPLVVGEFAADHGPDKDVAEDAIINRAEELGLGYLGWSWSGNNAELSSLDMTVNFNVGSLTPWGERLLNGQNGIGQTGKPCSCFE